MNARSRASTDNPSTPATISGEGEQQRCLHSSRARCLGWAAAGRPAKAPQQDSCSRPINNPGHRRRRLRGLRDHPDRTQKSGYRFTSECATSITARTASTCFPTSEPEDLIKYGLIPEFVGRLPVVATSDDSMNRRCPSSSPEPQERAHKSTVAFRDGGGRARVPRGGAARGCAPRHAAQDRGAGPAHHPRDRAARYQCIILPSMRNVSQIVIDETVIEGQTNPTWCTVPETMPAATVDEPAAPPTEPSMGPLSMPRSASAPACEARHLETRCRHLLPLHEGSKPSPVLTPSRGPLSHRGLSVSEPTTLLLDSPGSKTCRLRRCATSWFTPHCGIPLFVGREKSSQALYVAIPGQAHHLVARTGRFGTIPRGTTCTVSPPSRRSCTCLKLPDGTVQVLGRGFRSRPHRKATAPVSTTPPCHSAAGRGELRGKSSTAGALGHLPFLAITEAQQEGPPEVLTALPSSSSRAPCRYRGGPHVA